MRKEKASLTGQDASNDHFRPILANGRLGSALCVADPLLLLGIKRADLHAPSHLALERICHQDWPVRPENNL